MDVRTLLRFRARSSGGETTKRSTVKGVKIGAFVASLASVLGASSALYLAPPATFGPHPGAVVASYLTQLDSRAALFWAALNGMALTGFALIALLRFRSSASPIKCLGFAAFITGAWYFLFSAVLDVSLSTSRIYQTWPYSPVIDWWSALAIERTPTTLGIYAFGAFAIAMLGYLLYTRNLMSTLKLGGVSIFIFELSLWAFCPSWMGSHVTMFADWYVNGFYILSNWTILGLAAALSGVSMWRRW